MPLIEICSERGKLLMHSASMNKHASEASLIIQELWAKMIQAFYMHHPT
jgi:hypothetical protein